MKIKDMMVKVAESNMDVADKSTIMVALSKLLSVGADDYPYQIVKEGDIIEICKAWTCEPGIYVVAKIIDVSDRFEDCGYGTNIAILYSPMRKDLSWATDWYYTNPEHCKIINYVDPKIIFREDVKCV